MMPARGTISLGCGKLACVATVRVHGNGTRAVPIWLPPCLLRSLVAALPLACLCPQ